MPRALKYPLRRIPKTEIFNKDRENESHNL